ncbi:MAG: YkvA family protein [Treponemataceae bacterium]
MNKEILDKIFNKVQDLGKKAKKNDIEKIKKQFPLMNKGALAKIWDKVLKIWDAFCSSETPNHIKVIIIGGFLYMILPFDIIPDIIPGVGLIDDATVLAIIFSKLVTLKLIADVAGEAISKTISCITKEHRKDFRKQIWQGFYEAAKITGINLIIILCGFLLLFLGKKITALPFFIFYYSALLLFLSSFIWGVYRLVITIKKSYKPVLKIIKNRSLRKGLAEYFRAEQPWLTPVEKALNVTKNIFPSFEKIPELENIIDDYIQFIKKDCLIILGSFCAYYILLNIFLRIFIAEQLSTIPVISLYLFPFLHFFSL